MPVEAIELGLLKMLSFATEFPLSIKRSRADFVAAIKSWLLGSPHTSFTEDDFLNIDTNGDQEIRKGNQSLRVISTSFGSDDVLALKNTMLDNGIEWVTDIVYSRRPIDAWVGVRTFRESDSPAVRLPPAKKPRVILAIIQQLGEAADGLLQTSCEPIILNNSDIPLASEIVSGDSGCHLPVVYLSCTSSGRYLVDATSLAHDLAGMAHVVLEPNRPFSRRLKIEVSSDNVYGGAIGIYWSDATGRRSVFSGSSFGSPYELKKAITDNIRAALLHRRSFFRCTWTAAQEIHLKAIHAELKASGTVETDKWISWFDAEIKGKTEQLNSAEAEILRLKREIKKLETGIASTGAGVLRAGSEQDLYPSEIYDILVDVISDALDRSQNDSRREHVLRSVVASNPSNGSGLIYKERIKSVLRDYKSMNRSTKSVLEELGFSVSEDGKHFKLVFEDDDRYTFILPKSGSDHRGGLNAVSDISKRLF